jgi:hypothetical protein
MDSDEMIQANPIKSDKCSPLRLRLWLVARFTT